MPGKDGIPGTKGAIGPTGLTGQGLFKNYVAQIRELSIMSL